MKIKKIVLSGLLSFMVLSAVVAAPKYISPNNDGVQDELIIPLHISDTRYVQSWTLVIMDENKNVIRTIGNKVALPEKVGFKSFFKQLVSTKQGVLIPESVSWNGAMNNGETAPDGRYFYYVTATDDNGNVGKTKDYEVIIDTVAPEINLVQPADKIFGEGAKSSLKIRQSGSKEDLWIGRFLNLEGNAVKSYKWIDSEPEDFFWYGTDDEGTQIPDGVYSYEITATDKAGNKAPYSVISNIIYSADKPSTNITIAGSKYFSPKTESLLQNITLNLTIPVPEVKTGNKLVEWNVSIEDKNHKTVKTFNNVKDGEVPPSSITFDGMDDAGKLLPDGEYQASVTAKYLNGYIPAKISSPVIVLDTKKPEAQIKASDKVFGAGSKNTVKFAIAISANGGAPVNSWTGEIRSTETGATVKTYNLGQYPAESITWNGIGDDGKRASQGKYQLVITGEDLAGNIGGGTSAEAVTFDTTEVDLILAVNEAAFSPNGNKVKDTITITPVTETKDVASYIFVIKNASGNEVYRIQENKKLPVSFEWNGKDKDGIVCADGKYSASLSVTAENGAPASAVSPDFEIDTVGPKLTAQLPWTDFSTDGDGNQDTIPVSIVNCTSEKLWIAEVRNSKDKVVKKYTWNGIVTDFAWDGTEESGNVVADGKYSILIYSTDEAGNSFSTEIENIVLDNRETKAYITAEYEGISPNNDKVSDAQVFTVKLSVPDGIKSWSFDIRREDGTSVYGWNEKDSASVPATITWNGTDREGKVCEGTFTGTLNMVYVKGNHVNAVSAPFICTATPPQLRVQTAPEYFSPDNDGVDDDLYIRLTGNTKAKIKNWSFVIKDPKGKDFWKISGKSQITERLVWDGLSNVQKDANGNAERVQSAMDYPYVFTVTDNLGMTSVIEGIIPVDVLVIREGNVLKMAVPSIIFESDASNFQNASAKLTQEQVSKNIQILNRIADILKKFKDYKVTIVGHANKITDDPNEELEDNPAKWGRASMALSGERAEAIKTYLTKKGVNASALSTEGMGGTKPVVNPKDKDNNWKNRRVEFILQK